MSKVDFYDYRDRPHTKKGGSKNKSETRRVLETMFYPRNAGCAQEQIQLIEKKHPPPPRAISIPLTIWLAVSIFQCS